MAMKKNYSCDICRDPKQMNELIGCKFSTLTDWQFSPPSETDGTHICEKCLNILREELPKLDAARGGM